MVCNVLYIYAKLCQASDIREFFSSLFFIYYALSEEIPLDACHTLVFVLREEVSLDVEGIAQSHVLTGAAVVRCLSWNYENRLI